MRSPRVLDEGTWESHLLGQALLPTSLLGTTRNLWNTGVCLASSLLAVALSPADTCAFALCVCPPQVPRAVHGPERTGAGNNGSWNFLCCVHGPQMHILTLTATFPLLSPFHKTGNSRSQQAVNHPVKPLVSAELSISPGGQCAGRMLFASCQRAGRPGPWAALPLGFSQPPAERSFGGWGPIRPGGFPVQ